MKEEDIDIAKSLSNHMNNARSLAQKCRTGVFLCTANHHFVDSFISVKNLRELAATELEVFAEDCAVKLRALGVEV